MAAISTSVFNQFKSIKQTVVKRASWKPQYFSIMFLLAFPIKVDSLIDYVDEYKVCIWKQTDPFLRLECLTCEPVLLFLYPKCVPNVPSKNVPVHGFEPLLVGNRGSEQYIK